MTRKQMKTMLLWKKGIGVKVTTITGEKVYLFRQSDSPENAIEDVKRSFHHGEKLKFYSTEWAKKTMFHEYLEHYQHLHDLAWENMDDYSGFEKCHAYKRFLINTLMDWTGCNRVSAYLQVSSTLIVSNFTGEVIA